MWLVRMYNARFFRLALTMAVALALRAGAACAQDVETAAQGWHDGVAQMRAGNYAAAEVALTTAIDSGTKKWRAWLLRGYARYRLGREGALEDLGVAAERHPEVAYVWAAQAMAVDLLNRFDMESRRRAITLMDVAVAREPSNAVYWALRGRLNVGANRFKEAMADFDQALRLSPDDPSILKMRYRALVDWGGHATEAERDMTRLKALDPQGKTPDPDLPPPPIPEP